MKATPASQRYSRQTVLPQIGEHGQQRLAAARVLVVGAGGLGAPVLAYLAAAGVGAARAGGVLAVCDGDCVDLSNLQRQILFSEADQGRAKVEAAAERLRALNSELAVQPLRETVHAGNVLQLFADYDLIVDASDNFITRFLVNDAAVKLGKPLVYGAVLGLAGEVAVFAPGGPCYRCLHPQPPAGYVPNCAEAGTLGSVAGTIGSIMAGEAIKVALGEAHCRAAGLEPLAGRLLLIDSADYSVRRLALARRPACPACGVDAATLVPGAGLATASCALPDALPVLAADALSELQATRAEVLLVDVRSEAEWLAGHLPGAVHRPLEHILAGEPYAWPAAPVLLYCRQQIRSRQAAAYLANRGVDARILDAAPLL